MTSNTMWGGRFSEKPAEVMTRINASIDFDKRLYREDIAGSKAHAAMLVQQGIIEKLDGDKIQEGLDQVASEIENNTFTFLAELEDIHMNIENRLREIMGDAAGRLHTARSRNDQVATDFKLWVKAATERAIKQLDTLQATLEKRASQHAQTIMPGFTHLQTAQPVTFGHHLKAYGQMFGRDKGRFTDSLKRLNECPLGAAALAGTAFPIDRQQTASTLGFDKPMANSLDAVSDRDFALEYLSCASLCALHLSRLAEELVLWCTPQFNFVRLSDAFSTGSSIMPQKRNPDAAELVRGKTGRVIGSLVSLAVTLKGLPLAYSKDMQEDKEPVFDAADTLDACLAVMTGMLTDLEANPQAMRQAAAYGFSTATDIADYMVREHNIPFREAHHVSGTCVKLAEEKGVELQDLSLEDYQNIHPSIQQNIFDVLSVEASAASRTSLGGAGETYQKGI